MKEKWNHWTILNNTSTIYYIESVIDSPKGFEVVLADANQNIKVNKQKVRIYFEHWVSAYRSVDEGLRLKLWAKLTEKYEPEFYAKKNFFKVKNSEYLEWLQKESGWYVDTMKPTHYVIMDDDYVLDIVATYEPKVELIEKGT